MRNSLKNIAVRIDALLRDDPFPRSIQPDFLAEAVRDYPSRGGKRLRPALVCWFSRLWGGNADSWEYPAAAVEVYHNWTLVHDDIIDQDAFRRNEPTGHFALADVLRRGYALPAAECRRQGENFAMLCGDMQQAWANDLLLRSSGVSPRTVLGMARLLQHLGNRSLVSGEALDMELALRESSVITPDEVRHMISLKTGALLQLSAMLGVMCGLDCADSTDRRVTAAGDFAMAGGMAFQLQDDYLGIFGDEVKLGKALGGDLREAKPTLLLLYTLQMCDSAAADKLRTLLHREDIGPDDLATARTIMRDCGAADKVRGEAMEYCRMAQAALANFPANDQRRILGEFLDYLTAREL